MINETGKLIVTKSGRELWEAPETDLDTGEVQNIRFVGWLWNVRFLETWFNREEVVKILENEDLDASFFNEIRKSNAFRKALRLASKKVAGQKPLVHVIEDSADSPVISFQFDQTRLKEELDRMTDADTGVSMEVLRKKAEFSTEAIVIYHKSTEKVTSDNREVLELVHRLIGPCGENYDANQFAIRVRRLIDRTMMPVVWDKRGTRFIPAKSHEQFFALCRALERIDPTCKMKVLAVPDVSFGREQVVEAITDEFDRDLKEVEKEIQKFIADGEKYSDVEFKNRINALAPRVRELQSYEILVGQKLVDARKCIDTIENLQRRFYRTGSIEETLAPEVKQEFLDILNGGDDIPEEARELLKSLAAG
jgi:hypothetical protein